MIHPFILERALERLRDLQEEQRNNPDEEYLFITRSKERVLQRYGALFNPENLDNLTSEQFLAFLSFRENGHWNGLARSGTKVTSDMNRLRYALKILLDESQPVVKRIDFIDERDKAGYIPGLGKALYTAILFVSYPDKYGVWNQRSEDGLKMLDLWRKPAAHTTQGQMYAYMNRVFLEVAAAMKVDLWDLDTLWWLLTI